MTGLPKHERVPDIVLLCRFVPESLQRTCFNGLAGVMATLVSPRFEDQLTGCPEISNSAGDIQQTQ